MRQCIAIPFSPGTIPLQDMSAFLCDRCGKCCRSFGSFITIERQISDRDYYCRYHITGDLFLAHVDVDFAEEISEKFSDSPASGSEIKPCPFLCRQKEGDGFSCAVYPARPRVCREFRCYRMLIFNPRGQRCGTVIGTQEINTSDEVLAKLWKEEIVGLPHAHPPGANDPEWVKNVTGILAVHGYRGEQAE